MTETNDYRAYGGYSSASNLINSFDFDRSSAARVRPQEEPDYRRKLKIRDGEGIKSREVLRQEQKTARLQSVKIAAAALAVFVLFVAVLNSFALKNQLTRENARMETEIANAESEYISLESKLNSLVSISMIDKYAVEELGMAKVHSNQIQYMDVSEYKENRTAQLAAAAQAEAEAEAAAEDADGAAEQDTAASAEETADDSAEDAVINN